MKVCFVGVGSIAKRHIRNLKSVYSGGPLRIDVFRSKRQNAVEPELEESISRMYTRIEQMDKDYDVIFITNPTRKHLETLLEFQDYTRAFFIEKPVFDHSIADMETLGLKKGLLCYVACPLRYTNVIQYVKNHIPLKEVISIRCISSSYLPEWRAGMDYRNTYSAHKNLGGGVALDLIHEWDYLTYLFGFPNQVHKLQAQVSRLEIDSEDIAVYIAAYKDKLAELHLDYFGRKPVRRMELYLDSDTVVCDLISNSITWLKEGRTANLKEERNDFQRKELKAFLELLKDNTCNENDITHANRVLALAEGLIQ